ncbi:MAG: hypothetical protein AAGP08_11715 [Pseudomonadota bacterium]
MSQNLLGFDQVVALSQQTINSQLSYIWSRSFAGFRFSLTEDADDYINATTAAPVINVHLPGNQDIGEFDNGKVLLIFTLTGGSAQGHYGGGIIQFPDLTGYTVQYGVNLAAIDPLDPDAGVSVSDSVQQQLDAISANIYAISSVILDIDNIQYTDPDCIVYDPDGTEIPQLETVLESFMTSVKTAAGGNPFLLVFNRNLLPDASPSAGLQAFDPTSAAYRTELVGNTMADNDLNSVNLMIMTQNNTAPSLSSTATYPVNLGPSDSSSDGVMHINADQFNTDYLYNTVTRAISDSMQHALIQCWNDATTNATSPSFQDQNFFSPTSTGWHFHWAHKDGTPGDDDTYGSSPVVGSDSGISDIHQITQIYCDCSINFPTSSADGTSLELAVTGDIKVYGDWYEVIITWVHDGQVLVGRDFTATIKIEPGASGSGAPGALSVTFNDLNKTTGMVTNEKGKDFHPPDDSPHVWENAGGEILDAIASVFGQSTFKDISNDFESNADTAINSFFSDFTSSATAALSGLSSSVIMPTGDAYLFTTAQVDNEGNPKFTFTINSF